MRISKQSLPVLVLVPLLLAACSTTRQPAPVLDRAARGAEQVQPSAQPAAAPRQTDARGHYTVRRGDTLIQIALEFGQNYRDLVAWNNLANPNDIKVDQVLRVLPPEDGPQTGTVASTGVEMRPFETPPVQGQAVPNKSGPRGEKRPYSDATLAEMQKNESVPASAPATASAPVRSDTRPADSASAPVPDDENVSWVWPANGRVVAPFGDGRRGIAIAGQLGQPVLAASAGKVLYAGSGIRGYGNLVIVKHTNNLLSAYAHNKTIFVKEDQTVAQGQKIAEMGNSDSDEVKLHFEIRHQGKPVDPSKFLPSR